MSASGLATDPDFRARLEQAGANPETLVHYKGRVLDRLNAYAADARRQGMSVEFVQAYRHGKLSRFLLVHDPSLPERVAKQVVTLGPTLDWQEAMTQAGLIRSSRRRPALRPPTRYMVCPDCFGNADSLIDCHNCDGKGLVPSSDDS